MFIVCSHWEISLYIEHIFPHTTEYTYLCRTCKTYKIVVLANKSCHGRQNSIEHTLQFTCTLIHLFTKIEQDIVHTFIQTGCLSGISICVWVHTVNIIGLGLTAIVVNGQYRINIVLMKLHQHTIPCFSIYCHIHSLWVKYIVSILGTVICSCHEVIDESIMESKGFCIDIPTYILFSMGNNSGLELSIKFGILCLIV